MCEACIAGIEMELMFSVVIWFGLFNSGLIPFPIFIYLSTGSIVTAIMYKKDFLPSWLNGPYKPFLVTLTIIIFPISLIFACMEGREFKKKEV